MDSNMISNMDSQSPVEKYRSLLSSHKFVFLLFFRGHWCPFCMSYLKTLTSLIPAIKSAGGTTLIVTSEPASFLPQTLSTTSYTGEVLVDTANELAIHLKNKGFLDVVISEKKGYEHGMAQSAILVMDKQAVVYEKWAIVPSTMNMGGATDRPDMEQVWDNAKAKLEGREKVHGSYKKFSALGAIYGKFFG